MGLYDSAAWGIIAALALILVGGLMLWTYGGHKIAPTKISVGGPEAEATRTFHTHLSHWFLFYGATLIILGLLGLIVSMMAMF